MRSASQGSGCRTATGRPLERTLFALAGTVTLISAALAAVLSPWFLVVTAVVAINQWLFALTGACPMSLLLARRVGGAPAGRQAVSR